MTKPSRSPTDRLSDGFIPSQPPPTAPDGGPELEAAPTDLIPVSPISICTLGPCRHYHELASKLDAQEPLDGTRVHLPVFVTRTCYPTVGVEFDLSQPVKSCSLWEPLTKTDVELVNTKREMFVRNHSDQYIAYGQSWEVDDAGR